MLEGGLEEERLRQEYEEEYRLCTEEKQREDGSQKTRYARKDICLCPIGEESQYREYDCG